MRRFGSREESFLETEDNTNKGKELRESYKNKVGVVTTSEAYTLLLQGGFLCYDPIISCLFLHFPSLIPVRETSLEYIVRKILKRLILFLLIISFMFCHSYNPCTSLTKRQPKPEAPSFLFKIGCLFVRKFRFHLEWWCTWTKDHTFHFPL